MPDFSPVEQPLPQIPQDQSPLLSDNMPKSPDISPMDQYSLAVQNVNSNLPDWAKDSNSLFETPVKTQLTQTLRYADPNIGFNPNDSNLEDEYASAHPVQTFTNNLLKGGARFLGAAAETISTIPLAIDAAVNHDFSKMYDNPVTNGIQGWLNGLETSLPTYTTNYERDNPILRYLNPLKLTSFVGSIGNGINNFGFVAGAIGGSMVEDAAITAITGGAGFFPALAANGAQLTKLLGRAGRAMVAAPEDIKAVLNVGEDIANTGSAVSTQLANPIGEGVQDVGQSIKGQNLTNPDEVMAASQVQKIKSNINNASNYYKIRDGVKYNLALLTGATSQAAFSAVDIHDKALAQLKQQYIDDNGTIATGDDLDNIKAIAHQSANVDMGANIALMYLTNRINWGGLFKPTTQAFDEAITGWGGSIARSTVTKDATSAVGDAVYSVVNTTPETTIGKVLLNGEKLAGLGVHGINQALQGAGQYIVNEASMDYNLRKYNAINNGQVVDGMQSFLTGVDKTFDTKEGWNNMMNGMIGGLIGGAIASRILAGRGQIKPQDQLSIQADLLNQASFNGTFANKFQEAAVQSSLAEDYKSSVENKDMFAAKNIKQDMLYNWVATGVRANSYDARIEELDSVRDLEGKSFNDYWGKEDNQQNRADVNEFLDGIKSNADSIKDNYTKIDRLTKNPWDRKTSPDDYESFESYKDQLALNLSRSDNYVSRLKAMQQSLKELNPMLNVQKAIDMTSIGGMRNILTGIDSSMSNIRQQIATAKETNAGADFIAPLINKNKGLQKLFDKLQPLVTNSIRDEHGNLVESAFNGKDYVDVLQNLYQLHDGTDYANNKYTEKYSKPNIIAGLDGPAKIQSVDDLADNLQTLQDIYKLSDANLNVQRYYNYLRKGVGATDYMNKLKQVSMDGLRKYIGKDGNVKSQEDIKNESEQNYRFSIPEPQDIETANRDERLKLRSAASKTITGEELTPEEKDVSERMPVRFTHEVKIQDAVAQDLNTLNNTNEAETTDAGIKPQFRGTVQTNNLFGLYSQDYNDVKSKTNLYNAIFKSGNVFSKLSASYAKVDQTEPTYVKIPNTLLYRKSPFTENINLFHDGNQIGLLRPPDSLWLDEDGKRSIHDMTEEEYSSVTGKSKEGYADFMKSIKDYKSSYNSLKSAVTKSETNTVPFDELNKHFDLSINTGASVQNRYSIEPRGKEYNVTDPNGNVTQKFANIQEAKNWIAQNNNNLSYFDTLLGNINYKPKGTAIVSLREDIAVGGAKTDKAERNIEPTIINKDDLSPEQLSKAEAFLEKNKSSILKNANRYVVLFPIDGEYQSKSVIFARNANTEQSEHQDFFKQIQDVANGTISGEKIDDTVKSLNDDYFLANQDRTTKQTYIKTNFTKEGDLVVDINNPGSGVYKQIVVNKDTIQGLKTYGDLINTLQTDINNESQKDSKFGKLQVRLSEDSLKRQIPTDENVTKASQLNKKLQLATSADVFKNYNINFSPKGDGLEGIEPVSENPVAPVQPTKSSEIVALDRDLAGAKPRYSYQNKNFKVNFDNDIDKAAYITAQNKRSSRDADYLKFVMDNTGLGEGEVRALGSQIRSTIKGIAKDSTDEEIDVPKVYYPKVQTKGNTDISDAQDAVRAEYTSKRAVLKSTFDNSLTEPEKRVQEALKVNPSLAKDIPSLEKQANVDSSDVYSYSKKGAIYNEQFRVYSDIQEQKLANPTNTDVAIHAKTKAGIETLSKELFGLNDEQSKAVANTIDLNSQAWATRNGKTSADYYKQLGFKSKLESKDSDNILNQIIGEHGVKGLDNAQNIKDNLSVARQMDGKSMYSRSQIKEATGWEKGGDGKWRHEINYGKLIDSSIKTNLLGTKKGFTGALKDIYDNPELYKAYPDLRRIKVIAKVEKRSDSTGSFNRNDKITATAADNTELLKSIIHEVQHAIQYKEGFAKGGNPNTVLETLYNKYLNKDKFNNYTIEKTTRTILGKTEDAYAVVDDLGWNGPKLYNTKEEAQDALDKQKSELSHIAGVYDNLVKEKGTDMQAYSRLAGEVESRNAERRSQMTPEQRAENTLASTEDVDENSKIYLSGTGDNLSVSPKQVNDISDIVNYLGLNYKKAGANFGGFTSKTGLTGETLYNRVVDVINQRKLSETLGVRLDKTNGLIQFYNKSEQGTLFQGEGEAKGAYNKVTNTIYALTDPDVTTPLHELAHSWQDQLTDKEKSKVLDWANTKFEKLDENKNIDIIGSFRDDGSSDFYLKDNNGKLIIKSPFKSFKDAKAALDSYNKNSVSTWTRETSEKFASGFETYLAEGKSPAKGLDGLFKQFAKWLGNVVDKVKGIFGSDFKLNDNMRDIYAKMLDQKLIEPKEAIIDEVKTPVDEMSKAENPPSTLEEGDQKYKEDLHNSIQRKLNLDFISGKKLAENENADDLRDKQIDIKNRLAKLKDLMEDSGC